MIKFFNTLSGKIEPFKVIVPEEVRLYTCGPTVYDYSHIGNFRAYIFEDLLKRFLIFMGYKVIHVMNITDVDDKTIKGASEQGVKLQEYTKKYTDAFFEDIQTLHISRADYYPRATDHIPEMVAMVKGLLEKGYAYEKDGSVYFSIAKFPDYGRLSKIKLSELKPGQRIESDEYEKESANDFALWKKRKEGEPFWETEIGQGRPGWHIECSVMSSKYLGETFDIHCGGVDNIFPHHENEIAQSEACSGKKFVNYWLHCHHLIVAGEKMSKSKGNFYTLRDLLAKNIDPASLRFLLLSTHYRKMLNFTFEALDQSKASLQRIKDFVYELKKGTFAEGENRKIFELLERTKQKFINGLSDDLNISAALTALFEMIRKVNILLSRRKVFSRDAENILSLLRSFDTVLAVLSEEKEEALSPEIMTKIDERERARKEKNFKLADQIRNKLLQQGIVLEDTKEGVRWKIKK
jgi:cysteinyl-tRNA synthetase